MEMDRVREFEHLAGLDTGSDNLPRGNSPVRNFFVQSGKIIAKSPGFGSARIGQFDPESLYGIQGPCDDGSGLTDIFFTNGLVKVPVPVKEGIGHHILHRGCRELFMGVPCLHRSHCPFQEGGIPHPTVPVAVPERGRNGIS